MRVPLLALLVLLGDSSLVIGQTAPSPSVEKAGPWAKPTPADNQLQLVVALFRHGVRSPSPNFEPDQAGNSSKNKWPDLPQWKVMDAPDCDKGKGWGYLTKRGQQLALALGVYYGKYYGREAWPGTFNVYLWADSGNQRTRETGKALAAGFEQSGSKPRVTVSWLLPDCSGDPLFHPFAKGCGMPDADKLNAFAASINQDWLMWAMTVHQGDFQQLADLLGCLNKDQCPMPLKWVTGCAQMCLVPSGDCNSPIQWKGRYAYASSASEAFLLEYANQMDVGWGKVNPPNLGASAKLRDMLRLHEFYFDKTDRFLGDNKLADSYLASIEGSNLIREILDQITRKVDGKTDGACPRANAESNFVGLIGHDTNLATVGALLELNWQFEDKALPADTLGLPANDALPAGALVFELRRRNNGDHFVRVDYVAQSLDQMRNGPADRPFHLAVDGPACAQKRPCEMSLNDFEQLVKRKMRREFLSSCTQVNPPAQTCGSAQ